MTCARVLGLIDAGPFAGYPRAHIDAARLHARQCATCRAALDAATALAMELAALPRPSPPPDLAAAVLARIAVIETHQPVVRPAPRRHGKPRAIIPEWSTLATLGGGLAGGLAIASSMPPGEGVPIDLASPVLRAVLPALPAMPSTAGLALLLAAGLGLYVAGLFAPVRGQRSL